MAHPTSWQSEGVSDTTTSPSAQPDPGPGSDDANDLGALVGEWLDWAACGAALGVSVSKVRQLIREHQLAPKAMLAFESDDNFKALAAALEPIGIRSD